MGNKILVRGGESPLFLDVADVTFAGVTGAGNLWFVKIVLKSGSSITIEHPKKDEAFELVRRISDRA